MACESFSFNLPAIYYGDTWPGMTFGLSSTSTELAGTLTSVTMGFRQSDDTTDTLTKTVGSGITINTATANAWNVTVAQILEFPLAVGFWRYYITLTDDAGIVQTRRHRFRAYSTDGRNQIPDQCRGY